MNASPDRCDRLIRGTVITVDPDRRVIEDGYVAITDGLITEIGVYGTQTVTADHVEGGPDDVIVPGLVNMHAHLVQGVIRGMGEGFTGTPFERFLGFQFPVSAACDEERSYVSALPTMIELLRAGVTTTEDGHFTHRYKRSIDGVIRAANAVGMRLYSARLIVNDPDCVLDYMFEDVDTGLKEAQRVADEWQSDLVTVTAGTVGLTYIGFDDLAPIHEWTVEHGTRFDIHAPSAGDQVYLSKRGWTGGSFEWLADRGLLTDNLLAINAQRHVRPGEYDLVAQAGGSVVVVPDTGTLSGSTDFHVKPWIESGVATGIGLDGQVIAYHQNLWYAARSVISSQRATDSANGVPTNSLTKAPERFGDAELGLELATIGGARALGLDDRIGSLEVGKDADVVVIDGAKAMHLHPRASLVKSLVYGGPSTAAAVRDVFVKGNKVVDDGEVVGVDAAAAGRALDELQPVLLDELSLSSLYQPAGRWNLVTS